MTSQHRDLADLGDDHRTGLVREVKCERPWLEHTGPDGVEASLWRLAKKNGTAGLFEVAQGIYQVRGLDLANMTVVVGQCGYIVIDPLSTVEAAREAFDLVCDTLGTRPITALIFTHNHIDHFGGGAGLIEYFQSPDIPVCAPTEFFAEAVAESIFLGRLMDYRSEQMFGEELPTGPDGVVTGALGAGLRRGERSLMAPDTHVDETTTELLLDGVQIMPLYTPGAEAPAEMVMYFPHARALCMAEVVTRLMHNVYTPRGAQVRDALSWSRHISRAWELFGPECHVMFMSHHWPMWGNRRIAEYLHDQADLYRYMHDQTLRLANRGYGPDEIAAELTLPDSLDKDDLRENYGTLRSNVRGIFQRYIGWFDGDPANLDRLPPQVIADRTVDAIGGVERVLELADNAEAQGDLAWASHLLSLVLDSDCSEPTARARQSAVFRRLGQSARSSINRNFYLSAAKQLGERPDALRHRPFAEPSRLSNLSLDALCDIWGIRLLGQDAAADPKSIELELTDVPTRILLNTTNGVLHHRISEHPDPQRPVLRCTRTQFVDLICGQSSPEDWAAENEVPIDDEQVVDFLILFDPMNEPLSLIGRAVDSNAGTTSTTQNYRREAL